MDTVSNAVSVSGNAQLALEVIITDMIVVAVNACEYDCVVAPGISIPLACHWKLGVGPPSFADVIN